MRKIGLAAALLFGAILVGLAGCSNTQGTAADPDLTHETVDYKNNTDPQNTGAGSGAIGKPPEAEGIPVGGESASQALVKGTDSANSAAVALRADKPETTTK